MTRLYDKLVSQILKTMSNFKTGFFGADGNGAIIAHRLSPGGNQLKADNIFMLGTESDNLAQT